MSIIRAPRPDQGFLIISNEVLRDDRLSYRALGILVNILSRPDNWKADYRALAKGEGREGETAVRTALKELERAGYLIRRRRRDEKGHWQWDQIVYDSPQTAQTDITAGQPMSQESTRGNPGVETYDCKEVPKTKNLEEDELEWPAHGAGDEKKIDTFEDWRSEDLDLFRSLIDGDHIYSDGTEWKPEGRHSIEAFYQAFRKRKNGTPMQWPGRYFERISENEGVENYLMAHGLEAVE